jgi:hypothetical protein
MPLKRRAARVSAQNIQTANQKHIEKNQSEFIQCHQKKKVSKVTAQTVLPTPTECVPESNLDQELTDFCSRLHITPVIKDFHDVEDDSDQENLLSDQSSDIEEESELQKFSQALRDAQIAALKTINKNKRGPYSKKSRNTIQRRKQAQIQLASKGFLPLYEYMRLKSDTKKKTDAATSTSESENIIDLREESEEAPDEANPPVQGPCAHSSVNNNSEVESESEECLPMHNAGLHLRHLARMESEESTGDDDSEGASNDRRQCVSEDTRTTDDKEIHTGRKYLEDLRHKAALTHHEMSQRTHDPISQILGDQSKLRLASMQLTKESKRDDLDVIVRARVAAIVGLLNIYTDENLSYSWRKSSQFVAKIQGRGTNHARHIREWTINFLRWGDLPLHQLNRKRGTIVNDEDIAQEIKASMVEKAKGSFLKAQDVVEIVASSKMQAIFEQKGISKLSISSKTALRWLEKLGWTYGKLKNGMYLDGHERLDVVEYRRGFVERWMGHERRFHRWDHDGTELPRPNGFPVPGAIGRFRLILVTHDESTFFQNDERNTGWSHATSKSKLKAKGNGQSLMVSDFLTSDWGRLRDGDE